MEGLYIKGSFMERLIYRRLAYGSHIIMLQRDTACDTIQYSHFRNKWLYYFINICMFVLAAYEWACGQKGFTRI